MSMKDINFGMSLSPVYWAEKPEYLIKFNDEVIAAGSLSEKLSFEWNRPANDTNMLSVEFLNKKDTDTQGNKDKALIIDSITIEGFTFNSFLNAGIYKPNYPEGYYEYARNHGLSADPAVKQNYLAFNGVWELKITWPVFTWMHQTENLGWVYDLNI